MNDVKEENNDGSAENSRTEEENKKEERIRETGQVALEEGRQGNNIQLISVIGEIEGHENLSGATKTTK